MSTWLNDDGLYIKFGAQEGASLQQGGAVCQYGPFSTYVINLDLTTLTTTDTIINDVLVVPKDSQLESIEVFTVEVAATGDGVNLGLIANDRLTATDITATDTTSDPDGLLDEYAAASMSTLGEYEKLWSTTDIGSGSGNVSANTNGALLGKILTVPCLFTASVASTAYTTGKVQIRVNTIPSAATGFGIVHPYV